MSACQLITTWAETNHCSQEKVGGSHGSVPSIFLHIYVFTQQRISLLQMGHHQDNSFQVGYEQEIMV